MSKPLPLQLKAVRAFRHRTYAETEKQSVAALIHQKRLSRDALFQRQATEGFVSRWLKSDADGLNRDNELAVPLIESSAWTDNNSRDDLLSEEQPSLVASPATGQETASEEYPMEAILDNEDQVSVKDLFQFQTTADRSNRGTFETLFATQPEPHSEADDNRTVQLKPAEPTRSDQVDTSDADMTANKNGCSSSNRSTRLRQRRSSKPPAPPPPIHTAKPRDSPG